MGVAAKIVCVSCGMDGPEMGDFGHLGYPSLEDEEDYCGDLASFEYLYRGCAAVRFLPQPLEAMRAFLVSHRSHRVGLFFEGEEYAGRLPDLVTASPHRFAFDDRNFVHAFFKFACGRCGAAWRSDSADWYRPVDVTELTSKEIGEFSSRVLEADDYNFRRLSGIFDSRDARKALRAFLQKHRGHGVTASTVSEERWNALPAAVALAPGSMLTDRCAAFWNAANIMQHAAGVVPPLRLLWTYSGAQEAREAPMVYEGAIYTSTSRGQGIARLAADGTEVWRHDLGAAYAYGSDACMVIDGDTIAVALAAQLPDDRALLLIHAETGQIKSRTPWRHKHVMPVPGSRHVIASGTDYDGGRRSELGRYDLADPSAPLWSHAASAAAQSSFSQIAIAGDRLYTHWEEDLIAFDVADGRIVWRRSLAEFGAGYLGTRSPWSVSDGILLLDYVGLLALSTVDGSPCWSHDRFSLWSRTVCEGVIYLAGSDSMATNAIGHLLAVDVASGRIIEWLESGSEAFTAAPPPRPSFSGFPAVGPTHVFVMDREGRVWAFDKTTLRPEWMGRYSGFDGPPAPFPVAYGERLIIKSYSGTLYCLATER